MRFDIISIFPRMFDSPLGASLLKRAIDQHLIEVFFHDPRDWTHDKHRSVDDAPYGGGAGMVMRPEPLVECIESVPRSGKNLTILLSPQGEPLTQSIARELMAYDQLVLVSGRYEGVDERVRDIAIDRELSVGDYILSGGELAAMVVMDAVTRLVPGVVGNAQSIADETFEAGLLEYPHYTRPESFRGLTVPEVLRSGDHKKISVWRREEALRRTIAQRPDLLGSRKIDKKRKKD